MSKNTNRDYLIIVDVKSSAIREFNKLEFYINDKESHNIFVQLVIKESHDIINKYTPIDDPNLYELAMNIIKPTNEHKRIIGKLISLEDGLYEFKLPQDCCDKVGTYVCELETIYNSRITNSNRIKYKIKKSVLNDLDDIVDAPEYPIVIQLLDKLSDIDQYEEDRRANELARQLAEEQRQARFDTLDADMVDKITAMDDKMVDVENRVSAKEQAVDKLINDTKADIDEYKVAKDQEIDNYKTTKDTEINEAITTQDNKINEFINERNDRLDTIEAKNTEQDNRLDITENRLANIGDDITNTMQPIIDEHTSRLEAIEAIDVAQNTRLDAIEAKNQQQDDRLLDIEKVNKRQDTDLKCLFAVSKNNMIDVTEEGNSIYLQNSTIGYTLIDEIKGNTLVNCNKEPDKELILNGNINTSGDNTVTITEGVDGGKVDVALEGNTLVNVSKTKDSTAITKAYTVENSGNHVALQGDIDGSCRPVITGKTLVNLFDYNNVSGTINTPENRIITFAKDAGYLNYIFSAKTNATYTVLLNIVAFPEGAGLRVGLVGNNEWHPYIDVYGCGFKKIKLENDGCAINELRMHQFNLNTEKTIQVRDIMLLEGDYTDKPIPDYFEGLQSSFEDNLVTQEMVDSEKEVADNLGKYKVEYKVTGKNLYDINKLVIGYTLGSNGKLLTTGNTNLATIKLDVSNLQGCNITISGGNRNDYRIEDNNKNLIGHGSKNTITIPTNASILYWYVSTNKNNSIQIEEGSAATSYEPYKGYAKTLYLNSPLLEGDTIEENGDGIYHVHRSELVAYTEGDETSLITDRVHTLHQLASPRYELIEQSNLVIPSYVKGHLDFDTAVPVEKVEFKPFSEELTYLCANTKYTVQFISTRAILVDCYLGGALLLSQSIVAGLNRISITTPSELVDNKLTINGNDTGANIMEVIVTDADREFEYFEGMKSVGEGKELQVISINSERRLVNTQRLTHEPLRGTRDAKDRYVLIDGNWYIERKCGIRAYQEGDEDNYKTDLINTVYPLDMPIYEEIDYNPLEVYSGTTHITTNSIIPTNITVKNHGYNCLLKPSTTYTVASNLGLNTVTTPSVLTEDCLRFMDTDTSDVTTMRDVLVLEGDWTTKADVIPANFSGIESAFKQEYDAEKGKYKVNVKVANEDKSKENNITFYIDEPLRGIGDVKDRIYVKDDKVVVQRNCGIRPYEDGDFGTYPTDKVDTVYPLAEPTYEEVEYNDAKLFIESFKNSTLFYNSNVPVTSTVHYSYSVPIVDTVAQTANVTDQQDSMIIDLATQCAVMEIMLM